MAMGLAVHSNTASASVASGAFGPYLALANNSGTCTQSVIKCIYDPASKPRVLRVEELHL